MPTIVASPQFWPIGGVAPRDSIVAPPKVVFLYNGSASAWVVGDLLELDFAVTTWGLPAAAKQHAAAATGYEVGIAMEATPIGKIGPVQIGGDYGDFSAAGTAASGANCTASQGQLLVGSAATAGRLVVQSATYAATHRVVAIALEASASNRARVRLLNPMGL